MLYFFMTLETAMYIQQMSASLTVPVLYNRNTL